MSWALGVPVGGNAKVVLLGLANHAHADGSNAYPALDKLAEYAACDRSTARRNVRKLEELGWICRDGEGPRGQHSWQLAMGAEPFSTGGGNLPPGGSTGVAKGVALAPPEPSIEPTASSSSEPSVVEPFEDVPDGMREDAATLLKRKAKVGGQIVTVEEMSLAAVALAEFNRQADSEFGLGAHLKPLVGRIRERPSYGAGEHVRLVRSAWRLKWWERAAGGSRRATPAVMYGNERVFEAVVQDAVDEKAGRSSDVMEQRYTRRD